MKQWRWCELIITFIWICFPAVHIIFIVSFHSQVKMNSTNWPAPNVWVLTAQLVEHVLQRLQRRHGFESRWSSRKVFFVLICNCFNYCNNHIFIGRSHIHSKSGHSTKCRWLWPTFKQFFHLKTIRRYTLLSTEKLVSVWLLAPGHLEESKNSEVFGRENNEMKVFGQYLICLKSDKGPTNIFDKSYTVIPEQVECKKFITCPA